MSYKSKTITRNEIQVAIQRYGASTADENRDHLQAIAASPASFDKEYGCNWETLFRNRGEHNFANMLPDLFEAAGGGA
jgi:hypothetical protein